MLHSYLQYYLQFGATSVNSRYDPDNKILKNSINHITRHNHTSSHHHNHHAERLQIKPYNPFNTQKAETFHKTLKLSQSLQESHKINTYYKMEYLISLTTVKQSKSSHVVSKHEFSNYSKLRNFSF